MFKKKVRTTIVNKNVIKLQNEQETALALDYNKQWHMSKRLN